jgi:hypothetical protein
MAVSSQTFLSEDLHEPFHPALASVAERTVERLNVEFLMTGGSKPHVVFNLTINLRPGQNYTYKGARVEMDWNGCDDDNGDFKVTVLPYHGSSKKAAAAFDFPVLKKNLKIKDYWEILQGRSQAWCNNQPDLTQFDFVYARENPNAVDGCRDFMYVDRRRTQNIYVYY